MIRSAASAVRPLNFRMNFQTLLCLRAVSSLRDILVAACVADLFFRVSLPHCMPHNSSISLAGATICLVRDAYAYAYSRMENALRASISIL